jgi:hypothetical protein
LACLAVDNDHRAGRRAAAGDAGDDVNGVPASLKAGVGAEDAVPDDRVLPVDVNGGIRRVHGAAEKYVARVDHAAGRWRGDMDRDGARSGRGRRGLVV